MSTPPPPHDCPGCDRPGIPRSLLACKRCWARLPKVQRDVINESYRLGDSPRHSEAIAVAMAWYRANRIGSSR